MSTQKVAMQGSAAAAAMSRLAARLEPSAHSRAATLADHAKVAAALETCALSLSKALVHASTRRDQGLREVLCDAGSCLSMASDGAVAARAEIERMVRHLPRKSEQAQAHPGRSLLVAARWASEAAEALDESTGTAPMTLTAVAALVCSAFEAVPALQSSFGYATMLIDWACEDCGLAREGARASEPLCSSLESLRQAGRRIHVAQVVLRDAA